MGCVSSTEKNDANVVMEKGPKSPHPVQQPSSTDGTNSADPDLDLKIESAGSQRRRLSVAPLLVGDVEGKRANPTEGKPRRLTLGVAPPASEAVDPSSTDPNIVQTQSWVALSKKGYVPYNRKKMNQDTYFVAESFMEGVSIYGVCDGHGEFGHHVSAFVKNNIIRCLSAEERLRQEPLECIPKAIARLCADLNGTQINISFSGTTVVFAVKIDDKLIVGNIGDSRCIVLQRSGRDLAPVALSRDQKPDEPDEKRRILAAGGRVEPLPGPVNEDMGPCRVWLAEIDVPGLAMSRSIGDEISHTVGVTSEPELRVHQITESDQFLILASDGVWEFLSNQQVASIVASSVDDIETAATNVVHESTKKWQEVEEVIDDITFIILQLQNGSNVT